MHNDSKLGLLAGVAGVVVAAVLLTQQPAPAPAENAKAAPPPAATPVVSKPASTPVAARSRSEIEAKTTSRSSSTDEDE